MRTTLLLALVALVPLAAALPLPAPVPIAAAGNAFVSPALVVPVGTTVEWTGAALPHTVTSAASLDDAMAGNADGVLDRPLDMGVVLSRTFDAPGEFSYFCRLHVGIGMVGTITVA